LRSPPLSHIYLWSGWINKLNALRVEAQGHHHPLPEVVLRITHIAETILSILTKLCLNVPWMILFQSYVRIPTLMPVYAYKRHIGQNINLCGCRYLFLLVLIVRCFKKNQCIFSSFIHDFVTVSPLSSKTNNCYNLLSS
jgi:hypothetical protein